MRTRYQVLFVVVVAFLLAMLVDSYQYAQHLKRINSRHSEVGG